MSAGRFVAALVAVLLFAPLHGQAQMDVPEITEGYIDFDPYPLRPPDLSSPRDTLESAVSAINSAIQSWRADAHSAVVERAVRRAIQTLDLSELTASEREVAPFEKILLLKEILDRIELPPLEEIPGEAEVDDPENPVTRWTIPNTEITIAKIEEGPRAGDFLFTAETVANLNQYYKRAKELPYKPGGEIGIYEEILFGPGPLVPNTWAEHIPAWGSVVVGRQAVWQWICLAAIVLIGLLVIIAVRRWGRRWDAMHRDQGPLKRVGMPIAAITMIVVALLVRYLVLYGVGILGVVFEIVSFVGHMVAFFGAAWLVLLLFNRLADAIGGYSAEQGKVDQALVRIVTRLISIVVVVYIAVYAADFVGIPIAPLVAGLGVGGLAIALAVRPTLENIIGGLTLFADRPLRVGDFCVYGDRTGTVEEIGLRSTRVRSLERTIVTIPNAEFSQMQLENYAMRDRRLLRTTLGLRYETTPDQLRYVLAKLREMLLGHPRVSPDPARVRFIGYGAYSLDLEVFAYVNTTEHGEFLAVQEDVLLRIADIVADAGTGFAFPSQTNYFARDTGLDTERAEQAEQQVDHWREKNRLPFPEFDKGLRWEMESILDYPPKGSPDHVPRAGLSDEAEPGAAPTAAPATSGPERTPSKAGPKPGFSQSLRRFVSLRKRD